MTQKELDQIIVHCRPYYKKTGRWHAWDHIAGVRKHTINIIEAEFPRVNKRCAEAAAIIHDMGRTIRDEGHAEESGKIIEPFLKSMHLLPEETGIILDAVTHHDVKKIDVAKTLEARIVFDADKIEILSVYGFWRCCYWLVEERSMELAEAVNFLWDYCQKFEAKLYSHYAKNFVKNEIPLIKELVAKFNAYDKQYRGQ